jgi:hypothetical protein
VVRISQGQGFFSLRHLIQTGSRAHSASCLRGTGAFSAEVMRPGREADHSFPSRVEDKAAWSCTSTPPYVLVKQMMRFYGMVLS